MNTFIYFFVSYPRSSRENSSDSKFITQENKNKIEWIHDDENIKDSLYYYKKVFKINKSSSKDGKGKNYFFQFIIGQEKYIITFENKDSTFIYDVTLEVGKKIIPILRKIDQNKVEYNDKMEFFIDALTQKGEKDKIDDLYKDTIALYSKKKGFSLLIPLFLNVYKDKELCDKLLEKFYKMNKNPKDNEKNMDRKPYLKNYVSDFQSIIPETKSIIENKGYDNNQFYGLLLCYLNFYDYDNFSKIVNELFDKNPNNLFEILLTYNVHFKYPISQNYDLLNNFISYVIKEKDFDNFQCGLNYIKDIFTFINIIEVNKEDIYEKYTKNNESCIIKLDDKLKFDKNNVEENNDIENEQISIKGKSIKEFVGIISSDVSENNANKIIFKIIENITSIIIFSDKKDTFLIYFTNNFWKYILNYYNEPKQDNILICFNLRNLFLQYYDLVIKKFGKKKKKSNIKNEAVNYYEIDEFAFLLDKMIKKFIEENELESIEKLAYITHYNPYYIEAKYYNKVNSDIFDLFDLNNIDKEFIDDYREMKFELIFKENITEYINKIISKIKNISDFETIINLINIEELTDKNLFLDSINKKYEKVIKNEIGILEGEELKKAIKVVAKIVLINYIYNTDEKAKIDFANNKIKKLTKKIIPLVYIETINQCLKIEEDIKKRNEKDEENKDNIEKKDDTFKLLKDFIFDKFASQLNSMNDIDNIVKLLDCLEGVNEYAEKDKNNNKNENTLIVQDNNENEQIINEFLKKLFDKNLFTKEEYFSGNQNFKISLLYRLSESGKIKKKEEEYYYNIEDLIKSIKEDIEGNITKKALDEFLNNGESFIIERLKLIKLLIEGFNPDETLQNLIKFNKGINLEIQKLRFIKDNIIIYHRETYQEIIQKLIRIIENNQNQCISEFQGAKKGKGGNIHELINKINEFKLEELADKVDKVNKFLLFNVIYELNSTKHEKENFNEAYDKLILIKEEINQNNDINNLYNKYKIYFDKIRQKISNDEDKAQAFIKDFIQYYKINNKILEEGLTILFKSKKFELDINSIIFFFEYFQKDNKEWNDKLSAKNYENLTKYDFKEMKQKLVELQKKNIYDYEHVKNYNKLFTCLYDKNEAIDFLFSKTTDDMEILKDRIQPNDRILGIKDIIDTEKCIMTIDNMKKLIDNNKIFNYIKGMNSEIITKFENYSKIYSSVIELDRNDDISENIYEQVNNIIKDTTFNIYQDNEKFSYYEEKEQKYKDIKLEELIHLKNKIHNENIKGNEDDKIKSKCKILIFYKKIISNLQVINEYMETLRTKGSSLPIRISIVVNIKDNNPKIEYYLQDKLTEFDSIRTFLFDAKNKFITQLDSIYKNQMNIRFLFGKQFRSIMKHLESDLNINSFIRFILNDKNDNKLINEGFKTIKRFAKDCIKQYELYNQNSLDGISTYITSLFKYNNNSLEEHYSNMRIVTADESKYKGIYLHQCENNSMEEFILNLFWDKLNKLPIAQNVMITNKETSSEEIQAFFHRAILCNFNTLFVVELNDSFSNYQQSIMNSYIDKLLTFKNQKYNELKDEKEEKKNTRIYLDSCLVFVYDKNNNNITSFLNEIIKLDIQTFDDIHINTNKSYLTELKNISVITSDICGLGKSEKIKKIINDNNKKYFHFPLGGILTKNIIFNKLNDLLIKIENCKSKNIAIHLDLTESKEKSIINEFFFSFLITKFYTNNEFIIYIPQNIDIYIEIPNCFSNYLSQFRILTIFKIDNITLETMPKFNYPEETIKIFETIKGIKTNEDLEKFVKQYIACKKYSYHQINMFIKLFIKQYSNFDFKIKITKGGENITKNFFEDFAKCTEYFTNGGFAKLLTGTDDIKDKDKKDYFEQLTEIYDNDVNKTLYPVPLIYYIKEKNVFKQLYIYPRDKNKNISSKEYLERLKEFLYLPNDVEKEINGQKSLLSILEEKNNNYVITNDNFKKMVLLIYRIRANIPVIIMGDTGCGKTALITKLSQLLNNGEAKVEIINIHPGITDEKLCKLMKEKDEIAKKNKDEELWVFFDELNTCLSLSLLTEIFINRTYQGKNISDNIRLIGACNPYRKRKGNKEKYGLSMSDDNENELVYLVEPLPQSLLYYVFSFGSINDSDEKKYIHSIIEPLFSSEEKNLHEVTTEAISTCHKYLRDYFDPSVVSLREIARFTKCIEYFNSYFKIKNYYKQRPDNPKNNKIRSIICSIYLNYYIRLTSVETRNNFEAILRKILLKLVNNNKISEVNEGGNLIDQINNEELKIELIKRPGESINSFSDFLKIEEEYLIEQIELDPGIGKNTLLKENVFLLFLSVNTNIPFIIIGKPGSGKSLSAQLINKSMRGKYSKNKFFKQFPQIIQTYFQGSESTLPEDVENLFEKAKKKLDYFKNKELKKEEELPISLVLFDELGLAERSKSNPLKVLHSKLEYSGKEKGISFVGISNYSLDAAKINRALVSTVPDLDQNIDDLLETSNNIVESISDKLKNEKIFEILSNTYFQYKLELQFIKELVVYKQFVTLSNKNKELPKKDIKVNVNKKVNEIMIKTGQDEQKNENGVNKELKEGLINNNKTMSFGEGSKDGKVKDEGKSMISESEQKVDEIIEENRIEKRPIEEIRGLKEFKDLLKKEDKIRKDFHGNRDFYNLIKGIANSFYKKGDSSNIDKVSTIIHYIERNFGGIDYEIDINLKLMLEGIEDQIKNLKNILKDYDFYDENKKFKLTSVFLFKKLYNLECEKKNINSDLMIRKDKLNDYNLNKCINDNIKDDNSRFLLLRIKPSLTRLIYQKIVLQHPFKKIQLYDGSPFENDNNKEYRFRKINEIQDDAKNDKLIIIENLDQIHPFLFDLYNMNYIIKDEKKFARICLEVFNEQLTLVNDKFRIIILVNRKFVEKCNLAFLNRLEKIILSFNKLLDNQLKRIATRLIEEMKLKKTIKNYKNINYSLRDLLINSDDEEIQGLVYYFNQESKKNEDDGNNDEIKETATNENQLFDNLRENVLNKIYKILPQDIISILPDNNSIKLKYCELKKTYNFEDYINDEENKKYTITIIYTFTSITNTVKGLNKKMSFMVSQLKSEDNLKNRITDIKIENKNNTKEKKIYIEFEQSNSDKIKFVSNYILSNLKNDGYNYIMIIHINRNFNSSKSKYQAIYSLPDIYPDINQLFIDNLNGNNNMKLNYFLTTDIKEILVEKREDMKLDKEFEITLINYLKKKLSNTSYGEEIIKDYISEIQKYIDNENSMKEKIIEMTYTLIELNKDSEANCEDIIEEIYNNSYITIYTIDIVTCLIDYLKENIFNKYLKKIFEILEDNNILTTLLEIKKNNFKFINRNLVEELITRYLNEAIKMKNMIYEPKFLFNYNVPGFYKFFIKIQDYINKNIKLNYINNEKKLRKPTKNDFERIKRINDFYDKEESLINSIYEEVKNNEKSSFDVINKIPDNNLIFKDYITYYLQKYKNISEIYHKDDIYHKVIELLLQLRFNDENRLVKGADKMTVLLIKIAWIESNINYILNILKIIENGLIIFNNNETNLYNKIYEKIFKDQDIRYITNEKKNPEYTKEVNECFYIILASICYIITSDELQLVEIPDNKKDNEIEIDYYSNILKEVNKTLQNLNEDLHICLNEMYIIDELIKIIDLFKKNNNIEKINKIKGLLIENCTIIQKYANINNFTLREKLCENFEALYNSIIKDEVVNKNDRDYYDKLRYIFFKEIKKISDINYRFTIFEKIIEIDEIIKKSNNILQILLKNHIKKEKFFETRNNLLNADDMIVKLIENKLNDNNTNILILSETLLYFFEKNTLIFFDYILNEEQLKINLDSEEDKDKNKIGPLKILKDCIEFLNIYISKPEKFKLQSKEICKLYCLGYIRAYCYSFIKSFKDKSKIKINDHEQIFNVINGKDSIYKMIRLYIYKILYNIHSINFFIDPENYNKYKLDKYADLTGFLQNKEFIDIYKIDYKINTLKKDFYDSTIKIIEKYKNDGFKYKFKEKGFNIKEIGVDNFYVISYNLTLANLQIENSTNNQDFYNNICKPIFSIDKSNDKSLLSKAIQLFYDPSKYNEIKKSFNINPSNIKALLSGYRYCLNELASGNKKGIYYPLYDRSNVEKYLKEKLYPGNDTKPNKLYYSIINHFITKPEEGCYVCLCDKGGYYHSIPSEFPGKKELGAKCPKCKGKIGSVDSGYLSFKDTIPVKRDKYYRIFKDKKEIDSIKANRVKREKLKEINYMTIDEYKEQYIYKYAKNEKGIYQTFSNHFKSDEKIVRNLSSVSYRLLNYILYSHLFFARLITEKNDFQKYLPRGLSWVETISECWKILENELIKINIDSIEKFINFSFVDLFNLLNQGNTLENYDDLIKFENKLDLNIRDLIKKFYQENRKINLIKKRSDENVVSFINLLKEKFTSDNYNEKDFPFYEHFYYSGYLNEEYINKKLMLMDENKYPVLKNYLQKILSDEMDKNKFSLENLNTFNSVLNLIHEKYFNNISRENAKKIKLKDEQIYINNKESIEKFIKYYNSLQIIVDDKNIQLNSEENELNCFLIDNDNIIGNTYISIYKNFIQNQNQSLENLLDLKIEKGVFDINCKNKSNIQNINEEEIFTFKLPDKVSFTEILFNSSYKKILDSDLMSYELYKEYEINYDLIEEDLTDLLLKNKKLLNDNITEFIYNNELFNNKITNLITLFKKRYTIKNIGLYDKVAIYKFYEPNQKNIKVIGSKVINDFITLINFLNDQRKEGSSTQNYILEESKLYDVVVIEELKDSISDLMPKIFEQNDSLTVNKIASIFDYYLNLIYEDMIKELDEYQKQLDDNVIKMINKYYENTHVISKKELAYAIRIFITLVLIPEEEKEKKIKNNHNNVINYLKSSDLWNQNINDINFIKNLNEIKAFNIQINQIVSFYNVLGKDIENIDEVKEELNKKDKDEKIIIDKPAPNPPEPINNNDNKKEEEEEEEDDGFGKNKNSDDESFSD